MMMPCSSAGPSRADPAARSRPAVIAPYGHERRPGAAAEIRFDQTAPPEARLVVTDTWGGSIRMSAEEFRQLAREGVSSCFEAMAQIAESWP